MLFTIGYEGATSEDFIATLGRADVSLVVDIRDRPQSRRPGFSKSALDRSLAAAGVRYVHLGEFGDPKAGREAARAGDYATFQRVFSGVLSSAVGQLAIETVAKWAREDNLCLLCYERNPDECHRKIVAKSVEAINREQTTHLGVQSREQAELTARRVCDPREGASA